MQAQNASAQLVQDWPMRKWIFYANANCYDCNKWQQLFWFWTHMKTNSYFHTQPAKDHDNGFIWMNALEMIASLFLHVQCMRYIWFIFLVIWFIIIELFNQTKLIVISRNLLMARRNKPCFYPLMTVICNIPNKKTSNKEWAVLFLAFLKIRRSVLVIRLQIYFRWI